MGTRMRNQDVIGWLKYNHACDSGMAWVEQRGPFKNIYALWKALDRHDWITWLACRPFSASPCGSDLERRSRRLGCDADSVWCSMSHQHSTRQAGKARAALRWRRVRPLLKELFAQQGFTW